MFFIYMTYTLLALHVEECTVSGLLLGFTQVTGTTGRWGWTLDWAPYNP